MTTEQLGLLGDVERTPQVRSELREVALADIRIDAAIYPRAEVNRKRVDRYAEVMRDGVEFPPMEVEADPDDAGKFRILDGGHRHGAYEDVGRETVSVLVVDLDGMPPLLYAASRQVGPMALREQDARNVARRVYTDDHTIVGTAIAQSLGLPVSTVYAYIADLRRAFELGRDLAFWRMIRLGMPQERIADRFDITQQAVQQHLQEFPELENLVNADLARGLPVADTARKQEWPEPLVWALALDQKTDAERFEALQWGLRTWDDWRYNDVDERFGDNWPGRIPAQLVAHALYYFTRPGDLVLDPMAGGGVVPDVCLALGRRCWAFDLDDRPEARPEIEPHQWQSGALEWPVSSKAKPDLIFWDPPYYSKKADEYAEGSISALARTDYLQFFRDFFTLALAESKASTRLAVLTADWRDFQGKAALEESPKEAVDISHYLAALHAAGWQHTHIIQAPMSSQRFTSAIVKQMQGSRILGVVSRYLIVARRSIA